LKVRIVFGDTKLEQVIADIGALTKVNFNACIFGDGLPVTLRFADDIGEILTAIPGVSSKPLPFRHYIAGNGGLRFCCFVKDRLTCMGNFKLAPGLRICQIVKYGWTNRQEIKPAGTGTARGNACRYRLAKKAGVLAPAMESLCGHRPVGTTRAGSVSPPTWLT
jgi:hypothetical protein